jgi:hypothetical protein
LVYRKHSQETSAHGSREETEAGELLLRNHVPFILSRKGSLGKVMSRRLTQLFYTPGQA